MGLSSVCKKPFLTYFDGQGKRITNVRRRLEILSKEIKAALTKQMGGGKKSPNGRKTYAA